MFAFCSQSLHQGFFTLKSETRLDRNVLLILFFPQEYMKPILKRMPDADREKLERDLSIWIARSKNYSGVMANTCYAIPGHSYTSNAPPEDVTELHNFLEKYGESGDKLTDNGRRIAKSIFSMVKMEILRRNEEYFDKYHDLICFQKCESRKVCIQRRTTLNFDYETHYF